MTFPLLGLRGPCVGNVDKRPARLASWAEFAAGSISRAAHIPLKLFIGSAADLADASSRALLQAEIAGAGSSAPSAPRVTRYRLRRALPLDGHGDRDPWRWAYVAARWAALLRRCSV
jgi:hypothetical protein